MIESKAADTLARLAKVVGQPGQCPKCEATVLRVEDAHGHPLFLCPDGSIHWVRCTAKHRLSAVLRMIGKPGKCRSCRRAVLWIKTKVGKSAIYDVDGISHWATCPTADRHRKPKTPKGAANAAATDRD